ncbi:hypothetical protein [Phaeacidiphilus oryzae]|uniref:hypothetical protein n=1 Tax=Phaeacidiphilus oryzae TaxID=348818 RepID=UPI000569D9AD|nr:hypothetical protein [Phaeacidiphilus oryzae]
MIRPKYPEPVYVITQPTPPAPNAAPVAPCSCGHQTPAAPQYQAPAPAQTGRPIGLYLAVGVGAVAGTVALAIAVTALFLAIAVTAISVTVAAVVLRSLLADYQRDHRR